MATLLRTLAFLLTALVALGLFAWALLFVFKQLNLYPPQTLSIAAGSPGSAYHGAALAYREVLARDDITLEIIETAGSVENAGLLSGESGADIALVQGGVPLEESASGLAAVSVEPLWIFARSDMYVAADPNDWRGLRVAAGGAGSGTRLVADRLAAYTDAEALERQAGSDAGGEAAAEALLARDIDIALFVAPADARYLQTLFKSEAVRLLTLAHSDAVALRLPGARQVHLPSGILDYRRPFPPESVELVALVARLVAREGLHPALVNRLIHAVDEVHGGGSVIPADRQYPSADDLDIAANSYAEKLLTDGFSPLERVLPYWVVAQVNRILLVLVPALLLLLPLLRLLPAVFQWVFRTRVYRHYARISEIDRRLGGANGVPDTDEARALLDELDQIEARLRQTNLPNSYRKQAYTLLHHIDYVRSRYQPDIPDAETAGDTA